MTLITPAEMSATHGAAFIRTRPWAANEFSELLAQPTCFATGDARCFALARVIADEAELLTIACHPDHQRQGLASACMAVWQAMAANKGAVRAFLEVAADNAPAIALYRVCGFEISGLRKGYYRHEGHGPVDALRMSRAISHAQSTDS